MKGAGLLAATFVVVTAGVGIPPAVAEDEVPTQCVKGSGQLINTPSRPLARLGAQNLSSRARGTGVVVAVIDSGVDAANPHLIGRVLQGRSFVDGVPNARADVYGHGTAVAAIIAAQPLPQSMLVGLAPAAKILPVRVFVDAAADTPVARRPRADRIAQGIRWAATRADVINVSMSAKDDDPALKTAVEFAQRQGALVVASVGNRSNQGIQVDTTAEPRPDGVRYPAGYADVVGVTAVNYGDEGAEYDSVGGEHVDIAAPGVDVLTAFFGGDCVLNSSKSSTSFATAYVSAVAVLLRETYPNDTPAQIANRLMATAAEAPTGVRTNAQGWGLVKPLAALTTVLDPDAKPGVRSRPAPAHTAVLQLAGSGDLRADSREAAGWWVAAGGAGLALVLLVGGLIARPRRAGPQ